MKLDQLLQQKKEFEEIGSTSGDQVKQMLSGIMTVCSEFFISQSKANKELRSELAILKSQIITLQSSIEKLENNNSAYYVAELIDEESED